MNSDSTEEECDSRKMKLQEVELAIQQCQSTVHDNINLVIQRGDNLEDLQDKSFNLQYSAKQFRKSARQVRRKMYCQKLKANLFMIFVILFILWIILSMGCGFDFRKCRIK
jgi:t-SNARE complex subunit (syntaxin)